MTRLPPHVLDDAALIRVLDALQAQGDHAYLVGGAVRNALLGQPIDDIDIATDALAERVLRAGCTGVAFQDPRTARIYQGIKLYRTADGVRERDTRPEANPPRRARRRVSGVS